MLFRRFNRRRAASEGRGITRSWLAWPAAALLVGGLTVAAPGTALASCSSDTSFEHSFNGVFHGWERIFCSDGTWTYTGVTEHGHGDKFVEIVNASNNNVNCSDLESGSVDAVCQKSGITNTNRESWNEGPVTNNCAGGALYNDGHGIPCHFMEPRP
jgi:hypothetical protein